MSGQNVGTKLADFWTLLEAAVSNPGREGFWTVNILMVAAESDPDRACHIASEMILSDSFDLRQEGQKDSRSLQSAIRLMQWRQ